MPLNREQLKEYWQKNKEILNQKRKEKRRLAKLGLAIQNQVSHSEVSQVEPLKVSHNQVEPKTANLATANPKEVSHGKPENGKPNLEMANLEKVETPQLWTDYYPVKKPRCWTCQAQGIKEEEYKFCSTEKKPVKIYDDWKQLIHTFNEIYACNVYHWTIYHGKRSFY